ncbi:hypothetical protein SAMN05443572_1011107 [Myxococcus fulvus]|uniref:Carboxypeptidase regulatory-like domain-containing protein n=1 Tax=Myxococcus fulvus TaxID=33 RepID=A0A511STU7_MYXFU|nr:hypothetical protein [Myxococcus fulvus]GEN05349.1 hypothetical protein MFU01_03860 [Myxococcus fulvus]SET10189.1 hypothetical protein SAMN05443572_1011107 [Myxococcus fulvus]
MHRGVRWVIAIAGVGVSLSLAALLRRHLAHEPRAMVATDAGSPDAGSMPIEDPEDPRTLEPSRLGRVYVRTLDSWGLKPVPGITVAIVSEGRPRRLHPEQLKTDAQGMASFPKVRAGTFTVCAMGPRHIETCQMNLELSPESSHTVELSMTERSTAAGR